MKTLFTSLALLISLYSFSRKPTLEDISKQIIKAFNKKDSSLLRVVTVNYKEYQSLYKSYLSKIEDTAERNSMKHYELGENGFSQRINSVQKDFFFDLQHLKGNHEFEHENLGYLNYSYTINSSFNQCARTALITIYAARRDSGITVFENIRCYEINGGWKLYKYSPLMIHTVYKQDYLIPYEKWSRNYSSIHDEIFPYKTAEIFWEHLHADTSHFLSTQMILTEEEFKQRIIETSSSANIDYKNEYQIYSQMQKFSLHDSLQKISCIDRKLNSKNIVYRIENIYGGNERGGGNLQLSFNYIVPCQSQPYKKYSLGFFLFVKLKGSSVWKLSFAANRFGEVGIHASAKPPLSD